MRHLKVFLFFMVICFVTVGTANAADYDSDPDFKMNSGVLSPATTYCFEESYTGWLLQVDYDPINNTLTGTFEGYGPVYGIFYNNTLVWSFDARYPEYGWPVTYVGKIIKLRPLTFETYWVVSDGYKEGPYLLTKTNCP